MNENDRRLRDIFKKSMRREGVSLTTYTSKETFEAIFRKNNDSDNQTDTMKLFYPVDAPVRPGTLLVFGGNIYLTLNQETAENNVYMKSSVIRCTGTLNTNQSLVSLPYYANGISSAQPSTNQNTSLIDGTCEILTEDNDLSRKIEINEMFNEWGRTWKVKNTFYIDGVAHIILTVNADTEIKYTYFIEYDDILPVGYSVGDTTELNAHGIINGNPAESTLSYTSSNEQAATVDNTGKISFVGYGTVSFTITWKEHDVQVTTTETTIAEEIAEDVYTLDVSKLSDVYVGVEDGEATYSVKKNGKEVYDIPVTFTAEDCNFASKVDIKAADGVVTVSVSEDYSLINKTFSLVARNTEYGLEHKQTVKLYGLF